MAKKKKTDKCKDCGHRLALVSAYVSEVEPDQEPYKSDEIKPVMIDGQEVNEIGVSVTLTGKVCPKCSWVKYLEKSE